MDVAEAQKILETEKKDRQEKCVAEINEILKKYNCEFSPIIHLVAK